MSLISRKTELNLFTRNKVPSRLQKESLANLLFENKLAGEKGGKEGAKKDSKGDEDETASVTSYESSMVSRMQWLSVLEFINKKGGYPEEPMRTQRKTSKPPKARENAGNQVVIGVSFASDWLRQWSEFSGPITEQRNKYQSNPGLSSTLDWKLLFVLY